MTIDGEDPQHTSAYEGMNLEAMREAMRRAAEETPVWFPTDLPKTGADITAENTAEMNEKLRDLHQAMLRTVQLSIESQQSAERQESFTRRMSVASLWVSIGSLAAAVGSIVVAVIAIAATH
ncbi:hypothetical protein [Herbiconiux sp. UC225_62]|uniref:hypothetical protein n=1 Tax=Herbiconiux sp. UC225_62 TaxID=3350168 RepID=UPI0036D35348